MMTPNEFRRTIKRKEFLPELKLSDNEICEKYHIPLSFVKALRESINDDNKWKKLMETPDYK